MVQKSSAIAFCALAILASLFFVGASATIGQRDLLNEAAVIEALNRYGLTFNGVAEYGLDKTCNQSLTNVAGLEAAASDLIDGFFSKKILSYTVQQNTVRAAPVTVVNFTIGNPAVGTTPALTDSSVLYNYLKFYYARIFKVAFSVPYSWIIEKPVVEEIVVRDPDYNGASTAYLTAANSNEGFVCRNITGTPFRIYRKQTSNVYKFVFVLEDDAGSDRDRSTLAWRLIRFHESNKGAVTYPALPSQDLPLA